MTVKMIMTLTSFVVDRTAAKALQLPALRMHERVAYRFRINLRAHQPDHARGLIGSDAGTSGKRHERALFGEDTVVSEREVWWPARRMLRLRLSLLQTVLMALLAVMWFADNRVLPGLLGLVGAVLAACIAFDAARRRVETDVDGIWIVGPFKSRFVAAADIAEIRPNARGAFADRLVAVTSAGEILDLPLPATSDIAAAWTRPDQPDH